MAQLDRLPGDLNLYIGGIFTLRRKDAIDKANITHVLSVLRAPLDEALFEGFEAHKVVEVDDVDDENLLEHFGACNEFIQKGLDAGGGVFIHCAMGKSRSSAVLSAYLMAHFHIPPAEALARIREARPLCEPNEGFAQQLELYHKMSTPEDVETEPMYQRWLYLREVEASRACGMAPEADKIRFEDEHVGDGGAEDGEKEFKCRKCRRPLATTAYLLPHTGLTSKPHANTYYQKPISHPNDTTEKDNPACAHLFLDPLSWMRPELEQGKLEGRLECPKCKANVGKYAWQGMQCSCGEWVVPGISLSRGKVDESRKVGGAGGIRQPPAAGGGRKPGPGVGNL